MIRGLNEGLELILFQLRVSVSGFWKYRWLSETHGRHAGPWTILISVAMY